MAGMRAGLALVVCVAALGGCVSAPGTPTFDEGPTMTLLPMAVSKPLAVATGDAILVFAQGPEALHVVAFDPVTSTSRRLPSPSFPTNGSAPWTLGAVAWTGREVALSATSGSYYICGVPGGGDGPCGRMERAIFPYVPGDSALGTPWPLPPSTANPTHEPPVDRMSGPVFLSWGQAWDGKGAGTPPPPGTRMEVVPWTLERSPGPSALVDGTLFQFGHGKDGNQVRVVTSEGNVSLVTLDGVGRAVWDRAAAATDGRSVFVVGASFAGAAGSTRVLRFDTHSHTTQVLDEPLATPVADAAAVAFGGSVHVIGGWPDAADRTAGALATRRILSFNASAPGHVNQHPSVSIRDPRPAVEADPGPAVADGEGRRMTFDAQAWDPDGEILRWEWVADGREELVQRTPTYSYAEQSPPAFVRVKVWDDLGATAEAGYRLPF